MAEIRRKRKNGGRWTVCRNGRAIYDLLDGEGYNAQDLVLLPNQVDSDEFAVYDEDELVDRRSRGSCVLKCEAKGYNPRYCAEKCRNANCMVNCEAQGHNPRYCGEICMSDELVGRRLRGSYFDEEPSRRKCDKRARIAFLARLPMPLKHRLYLLKQMQPQCSQMSFDRYCNGCSHIMDNSKFDRCMLDTNIPETPKENEICTKEIFASAAFCLKQKVKTRFNRWCFAKGPDIP